MELDAKRMDIEHNEDSVWNEVMQAYLKNTLVKACPAPPLQTPPSFLPLSVPSFPAASATRRLRLRPSSRAHAPPLQGRVLNAVNAGYAVGIGGIVAFLPSSRVYGEIRLGHLHDFKARSGSALNRFAGSSCPRPAHGPPRPSLCPV